jgi:iron complex transport system substrate-binding protein
VHQGHQLRSIHSRLVLCAAATTLALLGTACGAQREPAPSAPHPAAGHAGYPMDVTADNGTVTLAAKPTRIVSLSPTDTEMLFAIGAGGQVTAVDSNSTFPAGVPTSSLSAYTPNVEAILAYKPDLVVASDDMNGLLKGLATAHVPTVLLKSATTLSDSYRQITTLGAATDHAAAAADVVSGMQSKVKQIVAGTTKQTQPLSYYYELDPTLFTATSSSFFGNMFSMLGMKNIADAAGTDGNSYPQLSAEYLASANPDLVFLADSKCCGANVASYGARPGNAKATAVVTKSVVPLDDDIASRWGPRSVDLLATVADALRSRSAG